MGKKELTERIAAVTGLTKVQARQAIEAIIDGIIQGVQSKEGKTTLIGFGTFQKVRRAARTGMNPATGKPIKIKASNVVRFRPGSVLKRTIK